MVQLLYICLGQLVVQNTNSTSCSGSDPACKDALGLPNAAAKCNLHIWAGTLLLNSCLALYSSLLYQVLNVSAKSRIMYVLYISL